METNVRKVTFRPPRDHPLSNLEGSQGEIIEQTEDRVTIRLVSEYGNKGGIVIMTKEEYLHET